MRSDFIENASVVPYVLAVSMVRQQFKKHMHEKDPEKIQKLKDDAARGLINHMLYESERLSGS